MFLQYLWGIETINIIIAWAFTREFYSTYEELKHRNPIYWDFKSQQFLQYLWGIET